MSDARIVRLDSRAAVERALSGRAYARVFPPRFEIASPALDADATREMQSRVERLVDACGCGEGSAVALLSLASFLTYALVLGPSVGVWGLIWRSLLVMFIGATVGKVFGVGRARVALYHTLVTLRDSLPVARDTPAPSDASALALSPNESAC